eukprot:gene9128-10704_t
MLCVKVTDAKIFRRIYEGLGPCMFNVWHCFVAACGAGNIEIIDMLYNGIGATTLNAKERMEHYGQLEYTVFQNRPTQNPLEWAIMHGHDDALSYLLDKGLRVRSSNLQFVIECGKRGSVEMIAKLLGDESPMKDVDQVRVDILKYALFGAWIVGGVEVAEFVERSMVAADVKIVDYLKAMNLSVKRAFCNGNAKFFQMACGWLGLEELSDPEWDWHGFSKCQGQVELIDWIYQHVDNIDFQNNTSLYEAVRYGHIELVKWIVAKMPSLDIGKLGLISVAIENNRLDMLVYLHQVCKCPIEYTLGDVLEVYMSLETIEYLAGNWPRDKKFKPSDIQLNSRPDRRWIIALDRLGASTSDPAYHSFLVVNFQLDEIKLLVDTGKIPIQSFTTLELQELAIRHGRLDLLKWMLDHFEDEDEEDEEDDEDEEDEEDDEDDKDDDENEEDEEKDEEEKEEVLGRGESVQD